MEQEVEIDQLGSHPLLDYTFLYYIIEILLTCHCLRSDYTLIRAQEHLGSPYCVPRSAVGCRGV